MSLLHLGAPALAPEDDLAAARRRIAAYEPPDAAQERVQRRVLAFIDRHPADAHRRSCREGHLTGSALVLDADGERVLLTHHRKLGKWLQLGGHCDGDANLPGVALREAVEESGIEALAVDPRLFDLDVHVIPARPGEPEHLHLDARFLVRAPPGARPAPNHESHELRWLTPAEARALGVDASVERLLRRLAEHA